MILYKQSGDLPGSVRHVLPAYSQKIYKEACDSAGNEDKWHKKK